MLVTGLKSRYVADTEVIHKEMAPGMSSMIKVIMIKVNVIIPVILLMMMRDTEVIHKEMKCAA